MHWWYFGFWSDTHDRVIRCVRTSMPTRVLCFMLVTWEDFTSDDVFAYFFNCFSGKCWSLVTSFLRLDYKQIHVCFVSGPLFSQGASSWIRTGRCGMEPSASSQDVFGLVVCFFYLDGSILIDKGKAMPETHWIHRPGARICGHSTRGVIPFMENGSKIEEVTHTLYQQDIRVSWASTQIFSEITFAQGHSLTHLVLRCRCPPISSVLHPPEYYPVVSYHPSRYPEFTYREECGLGLWLIPWATTVTFVVVGGCLKSRQCFRKFHMPWTTVVYFAVSLRRSLQEVAGEVQKRRRAHWNFRGYVAKLPGTRTRTERAGYEDKQKSRYCRVPDELEHEADAWYGDAQRERRFGDCSFLHFFFTWFSWVIFRLRCFVRPQHWTF